MKKIPYILFVASCILAACGEVVAAQPTTEPTPLPTPTLIEVKIPTPTWEAQTYVNEDVGFALDVPAAWTYTEQMVGQRGSQVKILSSPDISDHAVTIEGGVRLIITIYDWEPKNDLPAFVAVRKESWPGNSIVDELQLTLDGGLQAALITLQTPETTILYLLAYAGEKYLVFSVAMLIIGRVNAEMILSDYPPDIRAKYGKMSESTRKQANLMTLPLLATLGLVVALGLGQLRDLSGSLTFVETLIVSTVMFQMWNLLDLVLLDWFLLMTLKPKFMILPGTEGMLGYRDYGFHFRKFLNGIVFTFLLALIVTVIALGVELAL